MALELRLPGDRSQEIEKVPGRTRVAANLVDDLRLHMPPRAQKELLGAITRPSFECGAAEALLFFDVRMHEFWEGIEKHEVRWQDTFWGHLRDGVLDALEIPRIEVVTASERAAELKAAREHLESFLKIASRYGIDCNDEVKWFPEWTMDDYFNRSDADCEYQQTIGELFDGLIDKISTDVRAARERKPGGSGHEHRHFVRKIGELLAVDFLVDLSANWVVRHTEVIAGLFYPEASQASPVNRRKAVKRMLDRHRILNLPGT